MKPLLAVVSIAIVVLTGVGACTASGSSPDAPLYVKCEQP